MPLTEQLSQVNPIQGRNISQGANRSTESAISGLSGLVSAVGSATSRIRQMQSDNERMDLLRNRDEREQETHDLDMAEARREQRQQEVANSYIEERTRIRTANESGTLGGGNGGPAYQLRLRTTMNQFMADNPGEAEYLDELFTSLGDTGVAFTASETAEARAQAQISGEAAVVAGINESALELGFAELPLSERVRAVSDYRQAESNARMSIIEIELAREMRAEDAAQAAADREIATRNFTTSLSTAMNGGLSAQIAALGVSVRNQGEDGINQPDVARGFREDANILASSIDLAETNWLEMTGGDPELAAIVEAQFDSAREDLNRVTAIAGDMTSAQVTDVQRIARAHVGTDPGIQVFSAMVEAGMPVDNPELVRNFGGHMMRRMFDQVTEAEAEMARIAGGGALSGDPETYRDGALAAVNSSAEATGLINGVGGTVSPEVGSLLADSLTTQSQYLDRLSAEGGATFDTIRGFSEGMTNPETVQAVRRLLSDPMTAEQGRASATTLRRNLANILSVEARRVRDGQLTRDGSDGDMRFNASFGRGAVSIDPETGYMRVSRASELLGGSGTGRPTALFAGPGSSQQRLNASLDLAHLQRFASNYNRVLDTLVETDDWSEAGLSSVSEDQRRIAYSRQSPELMAQFVVTAQEQRQAQQAAADQAIIDMAQQGQLNPDGSTSPTPVSGRGERDTGVPPGEARDAGTQQSVVPGQGGSGKGPFNKAGSTLKEEVESDDEQRIDAEILELIGFNRAPPNVTAAALSYTDESNTYVDDRGPGWTVAGTYWPLQGGSGRTANTINRIFEGRSDMFGPGTLTSARSGSTLAHELVHRLFDVRPVNPDEGFEQAVREYVEYAGGGIPEGFDFARLLRTNSADGLATEQLPHLLRGFVRSPDGIRGFFGVGDSAERFPRPEITDRPRLTMPSDYDIERARERGALNPEYDQSRDRERALRSAVLKNLDRLYLEQMTDADWERIDRDHPAARETGRGRPTSD
jgi:hypothetical protein